MKTIAALVIALAASLIWNTVQSWRIVELRTDLAVEKNKTTKAQDDAKSCSDGVKQLRIIAEKQVKASEQAIAEAKRDGTDLLFNEIVAEINDEGLYGYGQLAMMLRAAYANPSIESIHSPPPDELTTC